MRSRHHGKLVLVRSGQRPRRHERNSEYVLGVDLPDRSKIGDILSLRLMESCSGAFVVSMFDHRPTACLNLTDEIVELSPNFIPLRARRSARSPDVRSHL